MIKCRLRAKSAHAQESCSPSNHQQQPCQVCDAQGKALFYIKRGDWLYEVAAGSLAQSARVRGTRDRYAPSMPRPILEFSRGRVSKGWTQACRPFQQLEQPSMRAPCYESRPPPLRSSQSLCPTTEATTQQSPWTLEMAHLVTGGGAQRLGPDIRTAGGCLYCPCTALSQEHQVLRQPAERLGSGGRGTPGLRSSVLRVRAFSLWGQPAHLPSWSWCTSACWAVQPLLVSCSSSATRHPQA